MKTLFVVEPTKDQPRSSEGDLLELQDGRLCFVYSRFTGGTDDHAAAELAMRTSDDGGHTWSDDSVVVPNEGRFNVMSTTLRRLQSGRIVLFYLRKDSHADCRPVMRTSTDEGRSWSEPITCITDKIGYYVLNNDRVVQLSGGRLLVPVALHNTPEQGKPNWKGEITCYLSDDEGATWWCSQTIQKGYTPSGERITVQEPGVIELKDGRLLMWCRSGGQYQYFAHSDDGGETWSRLVPSPLASPVSPASIKRVPWTGDLLSVWNDHSGRHPFRPVLRSPLCLAISRDEGETWTPSIAVEDDPEGCYCYTSIKFVGDRGLLAYCAGDAEVGGASRLKLVELTRKWLDDYAAKHP